MSCYFSDWLVGKRESVGYGGISGLGIFFCWFLLIYFIDNLGIFILL